MLGHTGQLCLPVDKPSTTTASELSVAELSVYKFELGIQTP